MRNTIINFLYHQAEIDPDLYLIVGDLGFSVVEKFAEKYPTRFLNAGIAEQNMIGVATGLAMMGKNVYVYSITPFVTMRCFEQIRNNLCYQKLPVKLLGVGAGYDYGTSGVTHHAIEDLAIMRALPNMTVVAPGNKYEAEQLIPHFNTLKGPGYMRISRSDIAIDYPHDTLFVIGKALEIIPHKQILIITGASSLEIGVAVHKELERMGITAGLVSMPTIKPLDKDFLLSKKDLRAVFTIEEHNIIGGMSEAVAHVLAQDFEHKIIFKSFGINDCYFHEAGSKQYLRDKARLDPKYITQEIMYSVAKQTTSHILPQAQQL